jgi:hypothetical protein
LNIQLLSNKIRREVEGIQAGEEEWVSVERWRD